MNKSSAAFCHSTVVQDGDADKSSGGFGHLFRSGCARSSDAGAARGRLFRGKLRMGSGGKV